MSKHIFKWGKDFGVRIPDDVLDAAGLKIGDPLEMREERGRFVIEKLGKKPTV